MPDSSRPRSFNESERCNVGDKTLRERTERPVVDRDNLIHEQTMLNEVDLDFLIPGFPNSVVKHAQSTSVWGIDSENWEPSRSTCSSTRATTESISFNLLSRIKENWFRKWATSNCVNCSRRNPRRSAQCVYHTGIPVSSTARAGMSCKKKEGPIKNPSIIRWTFQTLSMSSRRKTSRTSIWKEARRQTTLSG